MTERIQSELGSIEAAVARLRKITATDVGKDPLEIALRLLEARQRRDASFPPGLFGDPAWDVLLEAFVAAEQGKPHGRNSLFDAAGLVHSTGDRWLERLEELGLISSSVAPGMKRRRQHFLTDKGRKAMTQALTRMV